MDECGLRVNEKSWAKIRGEGSRFFFYEKMFCFRKIVLVNLLKIICS